MPDTLNILNILVTKLEAVREDLSHPLEETLSGRMDVIKPKPEHDVPLKYLLVLNTGRRPAPGLKCMCTRARGL